ncbi:transcriptional regulator (plasmid) [Nocardia sp. NBC_00511]
MYDELDQYGEHPLALVSQIAAELGVAQPTIDRPLDKPTS